MKLPVRFARILFLRSPGASARVRAGVIECNDEFVEGRIALYDEAGKPCVLVDGFRAISVANVRRGGSGSTRDVLYHVAWERTPLARRPRSRRCRSRSCKTPHNARSMRSSPCAVART